MVCTDILIYRVSDLGHQSGFPKHRLTTCFFSSRCLSTTSRQLYKVLHFTLRLSNPFCCWPSLPFSNFKRWEEGVGGRTRPEVLQVCVANGLCSLDVSVQMFLEQQDCGGQHKTTGNEREREWMPPTSISPFTVERDHPLSILFELTSSVYSFAVICSHAFISSHSLNPFCYAETDWHL